MSAEISPDQIAKWGEESEKLMKDTIALLNDPEWKESKKEPEIVFYTRSDKSSSFHQVKSVVTIPAPMEAVLSALKPIEPVNKDTPKEKRHGLIERRTVFGPLDDEAQTCIFYICLDPPKLVTARDFVLFRRLYKLDGGRFCYFHNSIETPAVPVDDKRVRGHMTFQGFLCEPEGNNVKLTFFVHADPKGSIPAFAYNAAATNQGYAAKGIRKKVIADLAK